jgi:hypothetical protein
MYVYSDGRRTVEVIPYVIDNGLFFVFEVNAAADPVKGRMLPLLSAQLKALEVLGVSDAG